MGKDLPAGRQEKKRENRGNKDDIEGVSENGKMGQKTALEEG